jgi:regulator of CtrA degradation
MSRLAMSEELSSSDVGEAHSVTFALSERLTSQQFDVVFKEGMTLVEQTASYLDGDGRRDSKGLSPAITVLYATESMRLTARLLDIASWLLIRRAVRDGELGENEARLKRQRLKLQTLGRPAHVKGFDELPVRLKSLIEDSHEMLARILELDRAHAARQAERPASDDTGNPVAAQVVKLRDAFRRGPA